MLGVATRARGSENTVQGFLSVDPLAASYPYYTPYQFAGNKPIAAIDMDGLEDAFRFSIKTNEGKIIRVSSRIRVVDDERTAGPLGPGVLNYQYNMADGTVTETWAPAKRNPSPPAERTYEFSFAKWQDAAKPQTAIQDVYPDVQFKITFGDIGMMTPEASVSVQMFKMDVLSISAKDGVSHNFKDPTFEIGVTGSAGPKNVGPTLSGVLEVGTGCESGGLTLKAKGGLAASEILLYSKTLAGTAQRIAADQNLDFEIGIAIGIGVEFHLTGTPEEFESQINAMLQGIQGDYRGEVTSPTFMGAKAEIQARQIELEYSSQKPK